MSLAPANQDIYYYNNDSRTKSYTITDGDGNAVDLSGDTITLTIKEKKSDSTAKATLSTASEITISGASNNVVEIALNHDFDERSYVYDLYNNTLDETLMYGLFIVTKEVN